MQTPEFKFSSFAFEEEGHTPVVKREAKNEVIVQEQKQEQQKQESTDNSGWVQIGNKRRRKNPK